MRVALQEHRLRARSSLRSSGFSTGAGMRAKDENSSTMRPMSPTCRTIVSVQILKVSGSFVISFRYLRLQPLGRELDRGQRVLDLVRDAAGDVGPGRLALRRQQLGDVVEGDDEAADLVVRRARRRRAPAGCGCWPSRDDLDLRLGEPVRAAAPPRPSRPAISGSDLGEVLADRRHRDRPRAAPRRSGSAG